MTPREIRERADSIGKQKLSARDRAIRRERGRAALASLLPSTRGGWYMHPQQITLAYEAHAAQKARREERAAALPPLTTKGDRP